MGQIADLLRQEAGLRPAPADTGLVPYSNTEAVPAEPERTALASPKLSDLLRRSQAGGLSQEAELINPFAEIPSVYQEELAGAREELATPGVLPKLSGALRYLMSPVRALSRPLLGDPTRRQTGSETLGTVLEAGGEFLIPGLGLTRLPGSVATAARRAQVASLKGIKPKLAGMPSEAALEAQAALPGAEIIQPRIAAIRGQAGKAPVTPISTRTKPLPVAPQSLAITGEAGLAYHTALNPQVFRQAGEAGINFFKQNPGMYDRSLSVTENIGRHVGKEAGINAKFLREFGLDEQDAKFVIHSYESMRQSAQSMAQMSRVSRELNLRLSASQRAAIEEAGHDIEDAAELLPWWRRVDNITRGAMVTQLGTAVRNAETVVARLGMDTMTSAIDNGLARMLGKTPKGGALEGVETFMNTLAAVRPKNAKAHKAFVEEIGRAFPTATKRLLSRYNSDIRVGGEVSGKAVGLGEKVLRGGEKLVDMANVWNRGQEFLIRRAVFQSKLTQEVRRATGQDINDIIKAGDVYQIPENAVNAAVDRALEVTFGATPKPGTPSRLFTDLITKTAPLGTLAFPFPRFLTQSLKFTFEHSPLGLTRLLSRAERAKIADGDLGSVSKAVVGSGLLGAAVAMREAQPEMKWYEYRMDDGKIVDLRPYAPFSTYLFAAEVLAHAFGKRSGRLGTKEVLGGLLGTNIRAGTGLSLVDSIVDGAINPAKQGDIPRFGKQLAGEYAARLTVPLAQVRDAYDEWVEGVSVARERAPEGREFTGPMLANLPGASRTLPEVESATQAGPLVTERPFTLKQLTGIRLTPAKNPGAAELERFGFRMNEILPRTGNQAVDRKYAAQLGPLVEHYLSAVVKGPKYRSLSELQKPIALANSMKALRKIMRAKAGLTAEERADLKLGRLPLRSQRLLDEARAR